MSATRTYLALGDSMSIDYYTGVTGGGAVNQFFRTLGGGWALDDVTRDGCQMPGVPRDRRGDLITLTIGGNDLLAYREHVLRNGVAAFQQMHASLLADLRRVNPNALLIVGDVYAPAALLTTQERQGLDAANAAIHANCKQFAAMVAPIHATFAGREDELLCLEIEPTFAGATEIARLFADAYRSATAGTIP